MARGDPVWCGAHGIVRESDLTKAQQAMLHHGTQPAPLPAAKGKRRGARPSPPPRPHVSSNSNSGGGGSSGSPAAPPGGGPLLLEPRALFPGEAPAPAPATAAAPARLQPQPQRKSKRDWRQDLIIENEREAALQWLRVALKKRAIGSGRLWNLFDADRSNTVTLGEFRRGLDTAGIRPAARAAALFDTQLSLATHAPPLPGLGRRSMLLCGALAPS